MKKLLFFTMLITLFSCVSTKPQVEEPRNKYKEYFSSLREQVTNQDNNEVLTDINTYSTDTQYSDWGSSNNTKVTLNIYSNNYWDRYPLGNVYNYYGYHYNWNNNYWNYYHYHYNWNNNYWNYNYAYRYNYWNSYQPYHYHYYNGFRNNGFRNRIYYTQRSNVTTPRSYSPRVTPRNNTRNDSPRVTPRNTRNDSPRVTPRNNTPVRVYNQGTRTQNQNNTRTTTRTTNGRR